MRQTSASLEASAENRRGLTTRRGSASSENLGRSEDPRARRGPHGGRQLTSRYDMDTL